MKKYTNPIIMVIAILWLTISLITEYNWLNNHEPPAIKEILLSGGYFGLLVITISIVNWLICFIKKNSFSIPIHNTFIFLYAYMKMIYISSPRPHHKLNFAYYDSYNTSILILSIIAVNLFLYLYIENQKQV